MILQATETPTGEIIFKAAKPRKTDGTRNYYAIKSGAENGVIFGLKWENVKNVRGNTKSIEDSLAGRGFVKQGARWVRK